MRQTFAWWRNVPNPELAREVDGLRQEALWFLLGVSTVVYLAWHVIRVPADGGAVEVMDHSLRHWGLFAIVMVGFGLTAQVLRGAPDHALACFVVTSALSIAGATWLLRTPEGLALIPLVALVSVVLRHPLAGLAAGTGTLGLLVALWAAGPLAFIFPDRLVQTGGVTLLTLAVAWTLGRILVTAIESSSMSQTEAWQHAQEARANRAELVQALKQLDLAYYRLQRANAALELAWKAADAAERAKTEFVTNISHELRTPLNLIIGFSEMILTAPESYKTPLPVPYRGDLNAIYRSAQHLLTLTNDVIDLARVGMDRLALVREPVDLASVVADAAAIVQGYIEAKGLALRLDLAPDLPVLQVDRLRVRQVLLNLLTNAARFTERGTITVAAERAGGWVRVAVADTGAGIDAGALPRVFEEFYHDGGTEARPVAGLGGVGLGLPLSKRLVELHGGSIGVESTPGAGSRFWFDLPVQTAEPLTGHGPPRPRQSNGAPAEDRLIVMVDAAPQFLDFLRRHLTGYRVIAAPDLPAAITVAADERARLILTAEGGPTLNQGDSPVPVVALPMPRASQRGPTHPGVAHLVKPVTRATLYETLNAITLTGGAGENGAAINVLIVDDDRRFVRLVTRMLQTNPDQRHLRLRTAYDGRTALDLMVASRPDLVLLDLTLPELDGAGLLAAMRASPGLADVPTIIISAQDQLLTEFPLRGVVSLVKPGGLGPEAVLRLIDGLTSLLDPPHPAPLTPTDQWPARRDSSAPARRPEDADDGS